MGSKSRAGSVAMDLLVPGLLGRADWGPAMVPVRVPVLERMLSRCRCGDVPTSGYESTLCALAGLPMDDSEDLPLARIVDDCRLGEVGGLLCAEPVFLRPDVWRVYLVPGGTLDLALEEAREFTQLFNRHFGDRGWHLRINDQGIWILEDREPVPVKTTPVCEVAGREVRPYLPRGPGGARLHVLMNEAQMLFHESELNRTRQRRGLSPINGLWFYGGGGLNAPPSPPWDAVWSDEPLARGLGRLTAPGFKPLPAEFDRPVQGCGLACLMDLRGPMGLDDPEGWMTALARMEQDWFGPIASALRSGILDECRLYDCAGRMFHLRKADRWRVWRPIVPLHAYLNAHKN